MSSTVEAYIARHLGSMRARTGANHAAYLREWRAWLAANHHGAPLTDLSIEHTQGWVAHLLDAGQAIATVRSKLAAVRALTRGMCRDGIAPRDACQWLVLPSPARRTPRAWLDADQLRVLLAESWRATSAVCAAVHLWGLAGLRPAEPLTVRVEDVDHTAAGTTIYVPHRKGGDADRLLVCEEAARAVLAAVDGRRQGPLLLHPAGGPHNLPALRYQLGRLLTRAGLPPIAPYGLRVGFITLGQEAGIPDRDLAAYVGHSSTATLPHYDRMRATVAVRRSASVQLSRWLTTP